MMHAGAELFQRGEMLAGLAIQEISQHRRALEHRAHRRILAVQHAQRVAVESAAAVLIQLTLVRAQVFLQSLAIDCARGRRSQRWENAATRMRRQIVARVGPRSG